MRVRAEQLGDSVAAINHVDDWKVELQWWLLLCWNSSLGRRKVVAVSCNRILCPTRTSAFGISKNRLTSVNQSTSQFFRPTALNWTGLDWTSLISLSVQLQCTHSGLADCRSMSLNRIGAQLIIQAKSKSKDPDFLIPALSVVPLPIPISQHRCMKFTLNT